MIKDRRHLINESLGISDDVLRLTNEIYREILSRCEHGTKYIVKNGGGTCYKGLFNIEVGKYFQNLKILKVVYLIYDLKSEDVYDFISQQDKIGCYCDYNERLLSLKLAFVKGEPYDNFKGNIGHEINHLLQIDKGQKKNENLYEIVKEKFVNGEIWEKYVAYALYLSFQTEQSSFINQFYQFLVAKNVPKNEMPDNGENPYYNFQRAFDRVESLDLTDEKMMKSFGLTKNKLYNILLSAEERIYRKTVNTWSKYVYETEIKKRNGVKRLNFLLECYSNGITEEVFDYI